jgi:hypothetical protein
MSTDHTAAGLTWCNAGILIMEDGLMYAHPIKGHGWTSNLSSAATLSSFECVVLVSLAGIVVTAALLLGSSAETVAAVTAGLAL